MGIGGIGMSALARYFHLTGKRVAGYDSVSSVVSRALEKEGIEVFDHLDAAHISGIDMMIYTPAISRENIEYVAAVRANIPILKRSQALGIISREYRSLAVAGTHGKTTTSAMLTHVLRTSNLDCTAFLGGISSNINSNFVLGQSDLLVVEADEYDRSFLSLNPYFAIITSMDPDHLDIYGGSEEMVKSFRAFAEQSSRLLVHQSLKAENWGKEVATYSIDKGNFRAENLSWKGLDWQFDFFVENQLITPIQMSMPGMHNVANMLAALATAWQLGAKAESLQRAAATFSGIYRRFELHHQDEKLAFIDDYAHHPVELEAAILTAKSLFPDRQIVVVFQPHLFSRTRDFCEGFAKSLSQADVVLLLDIYPAREAPLAGISSKIIYELLDAQHQEIIQKAEIIPRLDEWVQKPSVVLSLGAGDIDREVGKIADWAKKKSGI